MKCICGKDEFVTDSGFCQEHFTEYCLIHSQCEQLRWLFLTAGDYDLVDLLRLISHDLEKSGGYFSD